MLVALIAFSLAAALIVLLPGPDTLVVVRSIVRGGRRAATVTAAGVLTGLAVWVVVAALGLSEMLRASQAGYDALRIAGASYLIWLGVRSLRQRRAADARPADARPADAQPADARPGETRRGGLVGTGFGAGLLTDLLNPKVGVFFVTFLPGFVPPGYSVGPMSLLFGAIFILETATYCVVLVGLAARVGGWMSTPRIRRRLDAITGSVLVAFGIRLAVES